MKMNTTITDVAGIKVGHATNLEAMTGCTVVLCEGGAVGGVDQRGGAPGTRETDLLRPMHLVNSVHAVMLAGGSAFGLDAATGAMRYLEEKGIGFNTGIARVPIVPAAIVFDLGVGDPMVRPDAEMGYESCLNASTNLTLEGNVGVGTGCSIGKILGPGQSMKAGVGSASINIGRGIIVGAIIAVNAWGDVVNPETGKIIAGVRSIKYGPIAIGSEDHFANTLETMRSLIGKASVGIIGRSNTVIGVVATNAKLNKNEANKVAQMAHNGIAKTIQPAHTMMDGDTLFVMATGKRKVEANIIGAYAVEAVAQAILRAVQKAESAGGLPGLATLEKMD